MEKKFASLDLLGQLNLRTNIAAIFMAALVPISQVAGEEQTQSEVNCANSPRCALLMNEKPDYNEVEAKVLEIVDADTMRLEIYMWPQQTVTTLV
jgi:hypothetical protein